MREGDLRGVPAGQFRVNSAFCLPGEAVVGGGYGVQPDSEPFLHPTAELQGAITTSTEWQVVMYNSHPTDTLSFFVRAECMAAMP